MSIKKEILFSVGPVMMEEYILNKGAEQLPYFRTTEFSQMNIDICNNLKELSFTSETSEVILLTASGTAAMEASVMNCFNKGDKLLVVSGGSFGERFEEICMIYQIAYTKIDTAKTRNLTREMLEPYKNQGYTGLLINAHETSTGVLYDLEMVGQFCKEENILFVVDAISSFLADEYYMDKWGIDVTIISSQKALALPPGLTMVILNEKTQKRIFGLPIKSLYFDFNSYISNIKRGQTPFTPAVGILMQLDQRLKEIKEQGVEKVIACTQGLAAYFRNKIADLPYTIPKQRLSNALTPIRPLNNRSAYDIFEELKDKYGVVVCPNGGKLKDEIFRVGHMGSLSKEDLDVLIEAMANIGGGKENESNYYGSR